MSEFESVNYFKDRAIHDDPYEYYDWLRAKHPVWQEPRYGAFMVTGLPAGEYYFAAFADLEPGEWNDPAWLDRMTGSAMMVTLRDGEIATENARLGERR